jgi:hypothetical protein
MVTLQSLFSNLVSMGYLDAQIVHGEPRTSGYLRGQNTWRRGSRIEIGESPWDNRELRYPMDKRFETIDWRVTMGQSRPQIPHGQEVRE